MPGDRFGLGTDERLTSALTTFQPSAQLSTELCFATAAVVRARYSFRAEQSWEGFRYRIREEQSPDAVAGTVESTSAMSGRRTSAFTIATTRRAAGSDCRHCSSAADRASPRALAHSRQLRA